jgi:hypothetical protein
MSEIKVNKISPRSGTAVTVGDTALLSWQTTPKTATFTAASGEGYFINQSSAITANLPAGSPGAVVAFADYARNFETYNLTISPNGSEKIGGVADDARLSVNGQAATFVYVDSTKGWINVQNAEDTEIGNSFITATGGTVTTVNCGACKVHTFTGPGTFCVSALATAPANNQVSYLVVAGGGGAGTQISGNGGTGGAGAGGFREDKSPTTPYTASPLEGAGAITVTATAFPITVGGGGPGGPAPSAAKGTNGTNSQFSTIISAGGGGGGAAAGPNFQPGLPGGSGGGSGQTGSPPFTGGTGNTPPTNPAQGKDGGSTNTGSPNFAAGGGGGATTTGGNSGPTAGGAGGDGATTGISGSNTTYAGGGGGGTYQGGTPGAGGPGGGGAGGPPNANAAGSNGTDNTGGGAGGSSTANTGTPVAGATGGSGVVVIRYKIA